MVIDAGDQLGLPPISQRHPADDVQLPQLHRRIPLPAPGLPLVLLLLRLDHAVADQHPVHRRPARHRRHAALAQLVHNPAGAPPRMLAAHPADQHIAPEGVTHPSVFWQQIFGRDRFKRPRVWYWYPKSPAEQPSPESRNWFDQFAGPADESAWTWRPWHAGTVGSSPADWPTESRGPRPDAPAEAAGPVPDGRTAASLGSVLSALTQDVPAKPSIFG
jgi:hypothetical protein